MIKYLIFGLTRPRANFLREKYNIPKTECKLITLLPGNITKQIAGYYDRVKNGEIKLIGWTFENFAEVYGEYKTKLDLE